MKKRIKNWFYRTRWKLLMFLVDREWTANLLWDGADPERPYDSIEEIISYYDAHSPGDTGIVEVARAIRLPTREYEWEAYAPDSTRDDVDYRLRRVR